MKHVLFTLLVLAFFCGCATSPKIADEAALEEILELERTAYVTWFKSDPTAYAEGFADRATYFDTVLPDRFDDAAIKKHLMTFAGKIPDLDYKFINPRVDLYGDVAIFTFGLEAYIKKDGKIAARWKSTAVLTRSNGGWEKVHAHWTGVPLK